MVMFNVASNGRQEAQLMHERCLSLIYHLMLNPVTKAQALRHDAQNITDLSMQTFVDSFDVRCGSLWVVVGRCAWLWVVVGGCVGRCGSLFQLAVVVADGTLPFSLHFLS